MKRTLIFIIKSFIRMALLLVCVSIVAFALISAPYINPLNANVGQAALGSMSDEQIAKLESYFGADEPPVQRYLNWAGDFLRGDMGTSLIYRRDVSEVIGERLNNSLWLLMASWAIAGIFGFVLGTLAGANKGKGIDRAVRGYSLAVAGIPSFWLALLLMMIFAVWLNVLPIGLAVPIGVTAGDVSFMDRLQHAILPVITLSIVGISAMALHTREKMADVMRSDYVLFARARGESDASIAVRHGLRNIALPAVTLQFASISEIISGSILVEQVFSYPGLGQAAVAAGLGGDAPLLLGVTVICAALVFLGNFTANVLYGIIDPRIRRGEGG